MGARVTRCSGNATGAQRRAYSRVCGAATALRPVAVGVGGAERGAPMSQSAYRRVRGAATPKGAAQLGCLGDRTHSVSDRLSSTVEKNITWNTTRGGGRREGRCTG